MTREDLEELIYPLLRNEYCAPTIMLWVDEYVEDKVSDAMTEYEYYRDMG